MKQERSFRSHSPDLPSFLVREPVTSTTEFEKFVVPREIILFSRVDEGKDTKAPYQAPGINQDVEPVRTSVNGDWEPFNLEPYPSQSFVNLYGGPYSQQMELNRANAERLIEVAEIEGKVIIEDLPMDRSRSIAGVNSDGSVTGRRRLFWGERAEDEEKPQSLVKPIPQGWRIEIPGQDIMEELSRKYNKKPLNKRFTARINQVVRDSLREIIFKEKLTAVKNPYFVDKLIHSLLYPTIFVGWSALGGFTIYDDLGGIGFVLLAYGINNRLTYLDDDKRMHRSLRSFYEYFMPPIEIDRVLRGLAFVNLKGRNLVRLRKEK